SGSVRLTIVLLNVASTCAWPTAMFLRSRRRVRTLFFFLAMLSRSLRRLLAAHAHGLLGSATAARVGAGPLSSHRQPATMALLAFGGVAVHPTRAVALDGLAAVTHALDRCPYLHVECRWLLCGAGPRHG